MIREDTVMQESDMLSDAIILRRKITRAIAPGEDARRLFVRISKIKERFYYQRMDRQASRFVQYKGICYS